MNRRIPRPSLFAIALALLLPLFSVEAGEPGTVERTIKGRIVNLPVPPGYCPLDAEEPSDARTMTNLMNAIRGIGGSLFAFAECRQLDYWRRGLQATLEDYGYTMAPPDQPGPSSLVSQAILNRRVLAMSRGAETEAFAKARERVRDVLRKRQSSATLEAVQFLGALDIDAHGLYFGSLQNLTTETGEEKTLVTVWTSLALNRRVINLYLFTPLRGVESVDMLVRDAKTYARRAHARNRAEQL